MKILSQRVDALLVEAQQMNIDYDDVARLIQQRREALQAARSDS